MNNTGAAAVTQRRRVAIVLFNLGGPDRPEAVEPFLFNLFSDKAILAIPQPFRTLLARTLARRRAPVARLTYERLGGRSPLLENTQAQADALERIAWGEGDLKVFIAMRYWTPRAEQVALAVKDWNPDEIVLLPLYPQHSTTTTASSLAEWDRAAAQARLTVPTRAICCYPRDPGFVKANARLAGWALAEAAAHAPPRLLFSAHGLPERTVARGDPYQWQCEQTAAAVVAELGFPDLDWVLCYQSRATPVKWIGPSTEDEIKRAGRDGRSVVVVPIAFVSEHVETLVEIGEEYRALAARHGAPWFVAVPTVAVDTAFIQGLASLVALARGQDAALCSGEVHRICPHRFKKCPLPKRSGPRHSEPGPSAPRDMRTA